MRKPRDIDAELKALQDKQSSSAPAASPNSASSSPQPAPTRSMLETLAGALLDAVERAKADPSAKEAWRRKGDGFFRRERPDQAERRGATLRRELQATTTALRRTTAALRRAEAARARTDTRTWMQDRRARTRRLIELGGLVQKSGLPARLAAAGRGRTRRHPRRAAHGQPNARHLPPERSTPPISSRAGAPPAARRCAIPINPTRSQPSDELH